MSNSMGLTGTMFKLVGFAVAVHTRGNAGQQDVCNKTDEVLSPDGEKMFRQGCFRTYQHGSVFHGQTNRKKGLLAWLGLVPLPACSHPLARAL